MTEPTVSPTDQSHTVVDPGDQPLSPDEEITEIEKLLAAEPDDFQARCRLGELYFSKGRMDDALVEVKKSIEMAEGLRTEMNRSLAMYYSNLGTEVTDYNTIDVAIQCYLRSLELDPKHLEGSFKLMELALNHKKTDLAIKVMEEAVEQNPEEPLAYYNLISVYDKAKMFEQAEQARKRLKERFSKRAKESSAS